MGQKLNGGRFQIVRKLGYGPRSSTWLARGQENYFAIKIYTIAASEHARTVEVPILKVVHGLERNDGLPACRGDFWEQTRAGSHLCLVLDPMSTTVQAFMHEADHERLPIHAVQRIVLTVANALSSLHDVGIMHGAVSPENVYFRRLASGTEDIKSVLASEPRPTIRKNKIYPVVISQPLGHGCSWDDKKKKIANWSLYLCGFGHAHQSNPQDRLKSTQTNVDYSFAPETLLHSAYCSDKTDIWMLGYMTFYLLTGTSPFVTKPTVSKTVAHISGVLRHGKCPDSIPIEWLEDENMADYHAVVSEDYHAVVSEDTIEKSLSEVLHGDDAVWAAEFIRDCLRVDPMRRPHASGLYQYKWFEELTPPGCDCGWWCCN